MPASDQGVSSDRYQLIPRTLIFVLQGERVLLIKGAPTKRLWANRYNGIGGHVERGEDILTAARRELREEAGLAIEDLWLCGTVTIDTGQEVGIGLYILRGDCKESERSTDCEPRPNLEGELEWTPRSELGALPLVEDLYTLLPRVLASQRGDPPFAAHYTYDDADRLQITFGE